MTYTLSTTGPIAPADAKKLGRYLALYAVQITGPHIVDVLADGKRIANSAAAETVKDTAAAGAGGLTLSLSFGPLLAPIIAVFINPVLAAGLLIADIKAIHLLNQRRTTPGAIYSEISFDFAGVGPQRLHWAEQLILTYTAPLGWTVAGLRTSARPLARPPTPWSTGRRPTIPGLRPGQRPAAPRPPTAPPANPLGHELPSPIEAIFRRRK